jgi:putative FmdB family regulatory protein
MPIYEYRCSSCGHELEALQKFSDAPLVACPSCSAMALVKKVSAAGFQLKGSGWYATDFKGSGAKPAPAKDEGAAASGSAAATDAAAKGDSKGGDSKGGDSKGDSRSDTASTSKSETKDAASSTPAPAPKTGATPAAT